MSQFGEFDIPEGMAVGKPSEPTGKPVKAASENDTSEPSSKPTEAPRKPASNPTRSSGGFKFSSKLFSRLLHLLLIVGGGLYVYNWFGVQHHGLTDNGSLPALIGGIIVGFTVINFVGTMIGRAFSTAFRIFRTILGLGLLGFFVYTLMQYLNVIK
jgi:hypothetical protein